MKQILLMLVLLNKVIAAPVSDFQLWGTIAATGPVEQSLRLRYWLEGQERYGTQVSHLSQALIRPGLGYAFTANVSLWLGYAWIYTTTPFAIPSNKENRLWQQFLWSSKYKQLGLVSRTRLEQRFIQNLPTAWRFRQLGKITIPFSTSPTFSLVSSEELFIHLNSNNRQGIDQNRFFIGLSHPITSHLAAEVGYLNQLIRRRTDPNFSGNYLALNLFLNY